MEGQGVMEKRWLWSKSSLLYWAPLGFILSEGRSKGKPVLQPGLLLL